MSQDHVRQAAVHVHSIARENSSPDALSHGFRVAAGVLSEAGEFSFGSGSEDRKSTDRLVQAVSSVIMHRATASEIDFSDGALDIARMTLASWSLDRTIEDRLGLDVPEGHDRFLRDVVPVFHNGEDRIGIHVDDTLLDHHVGLATRYSVLSAASLPFSGSEEDRFAWEKKVIDAHQGDELLGKESLSNLGIMGSRGEIEDSVMDAMLDALNAQDYLLHMGTQASLDAIKEAAAARMAVPGLLPVQQQALLAVDSVLQDGLGRPLTSEERRMGTRALDRVMQSGPDCGPFDGAARTMLLDVSIQMQAARTIQEESYGRRAHGDPQFFDEVVSASAGMDVHAEGFSPGRDASRLIAKGMYSVVDDKEISRSILDGLSEATHRPFSKSIDDKLALQASVQRNASSRISAILDDGAKAMNRGLGKGPSSRPVAALGSYVTRGAKER